MSVEYKTDLETGLKNRKDLSTKQNQPWSFWGLSKDRFSEDDWRCACREAAWCLAGVPAATCDDPLDIIPAILTEAQFGPTHWQMSRSKRLYYTLKPFLPQRLRRGLHCLHGKYQTSKALLGWPIEERFVRFQFEVVRSLLTRAGESETPYVRFWPRGQQYALVLTHDVETEAGRDFVRELAALEESFGFRSSFNFVPERYPIDDRLLAELRERGFEVGVHGLKHDGKDFQSARVFQRRVKRMNEYLKNWKAVGFRAPLTHRHPLWMQGLEIEYDSSFFDTDPYEPIPGGTMTIWPFFLGKFIELPYTLVQDNTLMTILGERTPRLWLEKVDFIAHYRGMALLNAHPDYLQESKHLAIYEAFLKQIKDRGNYWHALPREVAHWWRTRQQLVVDYEKDAAWLELADKIIGHIEVKGNEFKLIE